MKFALLSAFLICCAVFVTGIWPKHQVFACGPFQVSYVYDTEDINHYYPALERELFLDSNYEIILDKWGPEFLYPVYRDLLGDPLSEETKEAIFSLYSGTYYTADPYYRPQAEQTKTPIQRWTEARSLVTGSDINIQRNKRIGYQYFANCLPDAFITAEKTLRERIDVYTDEQMSIWLQGQDQVFAHCGGNLDAPVGFISIGNEEDVCASGIHEDKIQKEKSWLYTASAKDSAKGFPSFLSKIWQTIIDRLSNITGAIAGLFSGSPSDHPPQEIEKQGSEKLLEYDLQYQKAASLFYQWDLDGAEKEFQAIAENKNNPWNDISNLVLARVSIRKEDYGQARQRLENILENDSLGSVADGAESLLSYVDFRLQPKERLQIAEQRLFDSRDPDVIVNNLEDFQLLWYDNLYEKWFYSTGSRRNYRNLAMDDAYDEYEKFVFEELDDFSKWLYVWWNPRGNHLDFAIEQYKEKKTLPWLLASLKLMQRDHPMKNEILAETLQVKESSPAYLTAQYYSFALLLQDDKSGSVRKDLDAFLNSINASEHPIAHNYFSGLRMSHSDNLENALQFSLRNEVGTRSYWRGVRPTSASENRQIFLDNSMKRVLNELAPLSKWDTIAQEADALLNRELTNFIQAITFTRAIILEQYDIADRVVALILAKEHRGYVKDGLQDYTHAASLQEKKFTASVFMLKYWGASTILTNRYDRERSVFGSITGSAYRGSLWCPFDAEEGTPGFERYSIDGLENFISEEDRKQAKKELLVFALLTGTDYLADNIISYAERNPSDPRVPEALHQVVESTRFPACKSKVTSKYSERAFQILHRSYPNNQWTKKTPYWY